MELNTYGVVEGKLSVPTSGASNNNNVLPPRNRRKLSIPVSLTAPNQLSVEQVPIRRRFSNVGDAVTRKLSTTIGWRGLNNTPPEEILAAGRAMCILYMRTRLKRAGVFNRKLGLTRVRSAVGNLTGCNAVIKDIFPLLAFTCSELERMHPRLYTNIVRKTGPVPGGGVGGILLAVGHYLFRSEPSWGKVAAVYSTAGGLAVDCVRQGNNDHLQVILEDMTELLEERMAHWINANGGWNGLTSHCHHVDQEVSVVEYATIFFLVAAVLLIAYLVVKFFVKISVF